MPVRNGILGLCMATGCFCLVSVVLGAPQEHPIPKVNIETLARFGGLDEQTLSVCRVAEYQKVLIDEHLATFFKRERPKLLTYRAIWKEMRERQNNLASSAKDNTFDPCEFVTDEALEKACEAVKAAKRRFHDICAKANESLAELLDEKQYRIVRNAAENVDLPEPYRWLSLDHEVKAMIARLVRIHKARLQLAQKYPHLQQQISPQQLVDNIQDALSVSQHEELAQVQMVMTDSSWHEGRGTTQ